jgi:hypothetical protein
VSINHRKRDNFSYQDVDYVFVPLRQQMVSYQEIRVDDGGELDIEGEVVVIE